jgi:VWFA-related protein
MESPVAMKKGGLLAIAFCLATALTPGLTPPLPAQTPTDQTTQSPQTTASPTVSQDGFGEKVEVNVINVDVHVTDRDGNPVPGLDREDFELFEDGKRVEVSYFEEVDRGAPKPPRQAAAAPSGADEPAMPSIDLTVTGAAATAAATDAMHFVVYVDNANIRPAHRERVLRQLSEFLTRELRPGDRVMLATHGLGLQIRLPFTADRASLGRALESVSQLATSSTELDRARRSALQQILEIQDRTRQTDRLEDSLNRPRGGPGSGGGNPGGGGGQGGGGGEGGEGGESSGSEGGDMEIDPLCPMDIVLPARNFAEVSRQQVLSSVASLKVMVNSLSGLPGRKALLHVSDGISVTPGEEIFQALFELCGGGGAVSGLSGSGATPVDSAAMGSMGTYRGQSAMIDAQAFSTAKEWSALAAHANSNRVTLYTLQASGLEASASSSVDVGPGEQLLTLNSVTTIEMQNRQGSLSVMAADTGGRAIFNANDVRPALDRMRQDFDRYYSLGFTPRKGGDGREHRLEVKVKRRGLQARHPASYRDKPVMEQAVDRTLAALFFGSEENPLEISIEVGDMTQNAQGGYTVPVRLHIPLGKLFFEHTDEAYNGKLRLLVATQSAKGETSKVRQVQVPISVPKDQALVALGQSFVYELALQMQPGEQRVAVAIRDEGTALTSFLARGVRVGTGGGVLKGQR